MRRRAHGALGKWHVTERGITLKLETQEDVEQFVQSLTSLAAEVSVGRLRIYAVTEGRIRWAR